MAEKLPRDHGTIKGPSSSAPIAKRDSEPHPEAPWLIGRQRLLYLVLFNSPLIAALIIFLRALVANLTGPFRAPGPWQALVGALGHPAVWILLVIEAVTGFFWLAGAAELWRMRETKLVAIFTQRIFEERYGARLAEEWARYREGRSEYGPLIERELQVNEKEYLLPPVLFADLILRPALIRPLCSITEEKLKEDRRLFMNFLDHHLDRFTTALRQPAEAPDGSGGMR